MNNISNIRQLALESVSKYKDLPIKNITFVVESELDFWESTLFPIYDSLYLPRYQTLIDDFLTGAGFDVSVKKLTNTVFYVKEKRKKRALKSGAVVALPGGVPGQSQSVAVQPSIVGVVGSSSPSVARSHDVVGMTPAVVTQEPVAVAGGSSVGEVDYAWVYAKKSAIAPVAISSWEDELLRLKKESNGKVDGINIWSGADESMWLDILKQIDEFNLKQISHSKKWSYTNTIPFKLTIKRDEVLTDVYELLLSKLKNPIRHLN